MEKKYYIYAHINAVKNEIFYIGKGSGKRAKDKCKRSIVWKNTVAKYNYIIDILEDGLTQKEAYEREIFYIAKIGRKNLGTGPLVNLTDGGEGGNGRKMNELEREKLINRMKTNNPFMNQIPWNKGKKFNKAQNGIVLINSKGEEFNSVKKAALAYNMEYKTLFAMIKGYNKNKTDLKIK